MLVRRFLPEDFIHLAYLHRACQDEYHPERQPDSVDRISRYLQICYDHTGFCRVIDPNAKPNRDGAYFCLVATKQGSLLGYTEFDIDPWMWGLEPLSRRDLTDRFCCDIRNIYVEKDAGGRE